MDGARPIVALQFLAHHEGALVKEALHDGQNVGGLTIWAFSIYLLGIQGLLEVLEALFAQALHQVEQALFVGRKRCVGVVVGIVNDHALALQLQPAGQCGLVDLAQRAQVVVGNPLPQAQLGGQQDGGTVEEVDNLLQGRGIRGKAPLINLHHDGRIHLLAAKGDNDTTAHTDAVGQAFGQAVGVGLGQGKGQDYIN